MCHRSDSLEARQGNAVQRHIRDRDIHLPDLDQACHRNAQHCLLKEQQNGLFTFSPFKPSGSSPEPEPSSSSSSESSLMMSLPLYSLSDVLLLLRAKLASL